MKPKSILYVFSPIILALGLNLLWISAARSANPQSPSAPSANNFIVGHLMTDETTPRPVQFAHISATNGDTSYTALSNENGAYTITLPGDLPIGQRTWTVRASETDTMSPPNAEAPLLPKEVIFTIQPATKTADFTFHVPPTADGQIIGRVLISGTPPTVPPFTVTVWAKPPLIPRPDQGCSFSLTQFETTIDPATGSFTLDLPPNCYDLLILHSQIISYSIPTPISVIVEAGVTHDVGDVYLEPLSLGILGTIQGQVLQPDDTPVADISVVGVKLDQELETPLIIPTDTNASGDFTLRVPSGSWWVSVLLEAGDPYMPYLTEWQTTVVISAGETITDVVLRVRPTDSLIHGTFTVADEGTPADDACGVVAAYKQGEPSVYNYTLFSEGTFDMPVISGTYRLAVIPNPDLERLGIPRPGIVLSCSPGQYLATTVRSVSATAGSTTDLSIPLHPIETTLHNRFWDLRTQQPISGVSGVALGWLTGSFTEGLGTWTASVIDADTGVGDMPAAPGKYLVSYLLDPNANYQAAPGIISLTVPINTPEMDVNLPVFSMGITVTGVVLDPQGDPVSGAVVIATGLGLPNELTSLLGPGKLSALAQRDTTVTSREDGSFTLNLNYGVYHIGVVGPADILTRQGDQPWISPAPQTLVLRPDQTPPSLTLQYRTGDAAIHGQITLSGSQRVSSPSLGDNVPVLVWAATARGPNAATAGHTKDFVLLSNGSGSYSLPAIQGQRWLVGALYEQGLTYWFTQTLVSVDSADIPLDLTLAGPYTLGSGDARIIDATQPFYSQLPDGASLFVPGNLIALQGKVSVFFHQSLQTALANLNASGIALPLGGNPSDLPPAEGMRLLSFVYHFTVQDLQGSPILGKLSGPVILRIPYDEGTGNTSASLRLASSSQSEPSSINVVYYDSQTGTWSAVDEYVVDQEASEVIVFADQPGSYAVVETTIAYQLYLPLVMR